MLHHKNLTLALNGRKEILMDTVFRRPPVGIGKYYIFPLGAASFNQALLNDPEAIPHDGEIGAVFELVTKHGQEVVLNAAHPEHRRAARILIDFSLTVKGEN